MPFRPTHILDTSAVIAYLRDEPGADVVATLISNPENRLAIHAVNATEVYYLYLRSDGQEVADTAWQRLAEFATVLGSTDEQFLKRVGRWVANYNPGLGDAFAAALSEEFGVSLVTADHTDFEPIERAGDLHIVWVR